ncbi:MAG: Asd/ArgC dimerization domain-containing protein [Terriglobales bacterium]
MAPYRVGIVGAPGVLAKELIEALEARKLPLLPPRLLQAPAAALPAAGGGVGMIEFGDEAALLEPFAPAQWSDLDALFLAGAPADATAAWRQLAATKLLVADLSGALAGEPEARLAGLDHAKSDGEGNRRLIAVAHPAAQALALLLGRLSQAGHLHAAATVFEPASQRGLAGIQELEQQTRRMFTMQAPPQHVFGAQVAANLRAQLGDGIQPSLEDIRRQLVAQVAVLAPDAPVPALRVLQAPIFHASAISLYCRYAHDPSADVLQRLLTSPWLDRNTPPDVFAAAGRDEILLGPVQPDPAGGFWLFAVLDNLRRTAYAAADAAAAVLPRRA